MADTIRGKLTEAGNAVKETAKKVGNRIGEKAEEAKEGLGEGEDQQDAQPRRRGRR